ncbi:hypothetical protein GNI_176950 [Gregarina niphandrodes]|uniref:Uncharacterized protein n=1 Tax=Gregarina niphandrodes TaxID=110365 RepID=A0A023AXG0_GRENI|nr:hypothetical protein GNI_176950 [Gregarina niphandrodes]EZG43317.1 hypothetical protein GNI_176950 [Gregarina niphandrodes]|eukprot:XP_011133427.1 hypothetical protein GNI_176950 [Gregarina niphandrodes]
MSNYIRQPHDVRSLDAETLAEHVSRAPRPTVLESALRSDVPNGVKIVVGPVIGFVTQTTARIWVMLSKEGSVSVRLIPSKLLDRDPSNLIDQIPSNLVLTNWLSLECVDKCCPVVFDFTDLLPNTRYSVECSLPIVGPAIASRFKTARAEDDRFQEAPMVVGFTNGCPMTERMLRPPEHVDWRDKVTGPRIISNMSWYTMQNMALDRELDMLVHTGNFLDTMRHDPVHFDARLKAVMGAGYKSQGLQPTMWDLAKAIYSSRAADQAFRHIEEECVLYWQRLFNEPLVKNTLANVPSLYFFNETEIGKMTVSSFLQHNGEGNGFTLDPRKIDDISSIFLIVAKRFVEAFNGTPESLHCAGCFKVGPVGIAHIDLKVWPFLSNRRETMIGDGGAVDKLLLSKALTSQGFFESSSMLLVIVQEPLSFNGNVWGLNRSARTTLLNELLCWRDAKNVGEREVLLVAGTASTATQAGLNDIVLTRYASPVSAFVRSFTDKRLELDDESLDRQEEASRRSRRPLTYRPELLEAPMRPGFMNLLVGSETTWFDLPHKFLPRNRVRELVVPFVNKTTHNASTAPSQSWTDNDVRVYNYNTAGAEGFATVVCDAEITKYSPGIHLLTPSRPITKDRRGNVGSSDEANEDLQAEDLRGEDLRSDGQRSEDLRDGSKPSQTDCVKFWTRLFLCPEPANRVPRRLAEKQRAVPSHEFHVGFENFATNDNVWFPLPDDEPERVYNRLPPTALTSGVFQAYREARLKNVILRLFRYQHRVPPSSTPPPLFLAMAVLWTKPAPRPLNPI